MFPYSSFYIPVHPLSLTIEPWSHLIGFGLDSLRGRGTLCNRRRQELSESLNRYLISSYPTITGEELDLHLTEPDTSHEPDTSQELLAQFRYAQETRESDSESDPPIVPESLVSSEEEVPDLRLPEPRGNPGVAMMMANMGLTKQMTFSGEKGSPSVDEFLDNLELTFLVMEGNFAAPDRLARIKLLSLQNLLEGAAKRWWYSEATPEQKTTYETGTIALRGRFPVQMMDTVEQNKALAAFHILKQDGRTVVEYVEHVRWIHKVLGDHFQNSVAGKFVDGIEDRTTRLNVDAQVREPYILETVITTYLEATKSIRRMEACEVEAKLSAERRTLTGGRPDEILWRDPMLDMLRNQERFVAMYVDTQSKIDKIFQQVGGWKNKGTELTQAMGSSPGWQHHPGDQRTRPGDAVSLANTTVNNGSPAPIPRPMPQWSPTCVTCGKAGHLSRDCRNPPAPPEEQAKLRERYLRRRNEGPGGPTGTVPQPVAAGMAMVEELTPEDLVLLGYGEPSPNDQRGTMTMPIAMIEEISGG